MSNASINARNEYVKAERVAVADGDHLSRMDWSKLAMTHVARPVPRRFAKRDHLPLLTPVVGDHIRYLLNGVEVRGLSALGYLGMGLDLQYETYCDPKDWPYPPRGL